MAKPYPDRSGAGGHVHSSICRDGLNVFSARPGRLSVEGEHYLAGLIDTAAECTLLFNPFVNSFKRLDREMFVAEDASWGYDDRSVTCRVIIDTVLGARVEHRRPGADVSPYLAAAGLLAGGLIGLEDRLPLRPSTRAGATAVPQAPEPLPQDLAQAIERFRTSDRLAAVLGKEFVQAFADTRIAELDRYDRWLRSQITQYELSRHLEHL